MAEILVVGAGLGGLSSAIALAAGGHRVTVLEAGPRAGGKAGIEVLEGGVEVDTGPSLLTLPHVFDDLFRLAGTRLEDELELRALSPAFRYLWPDGTTLDVSHDLAETLTGVRATLGADAEEELRGFLDYARGIWEVAAPEFVEGAAPTLARMSRISSLRAVGRVDPMRSMRSAIRRRVRSPHLRDLLMRYATYNGSDPRRAPATLNCVAWVDLALGGYGVRGGTHALVRAMVRSAERLGVRFEHDTRVDRLEAAGGVVRGAVAGRRRFVADAVVVNADVAHLAEELLPGRGVPSRGGPPSTSAWNGILKAKRDAARPRVAHTVLFARDYEEEFVDLFDRERAPADPTVYLCAQSSAHARAGWDDAEPVFVMVNAPAEPERGHSAPEGWSALQRTVERRLRGARLMGDDDVFAWTRTPTDLARRFPGSRGALYGAASTSRLAAFRRPPNRVAAVRGLYLASGSAHPGGGMPLCVLSGRAAAACVLEDHGRGASTATRASTSAEARATP